MMSVLSRMAEHGSVYKSHILGKPTVFVTREEDILPLLLSEHKMVESDWPPGIQSACWGPHSLLNQSGAKHQSQRRIITQVICLFTHTFSSGLACALLVLWSYNQFLWFISQQALHPWALTLLIPLSGDGRRDLAAFLDHLHRSV